MSSENTLNHPLIRFVSARDTLALRQKVLKPHLSLLECINPGDSDPNTFHLGYGSAEKIICIASFEKEQHPNWPQLSSYRLRGMAVDPDFQGQKIGQLILLNGLRILRDKKVQLLWCNARVKAFSFYERLGFAFQGEFFDLPQIGAHKVMYKKL